MANVTYNGQTFGVVEQETVLEALLRQGVEAAHACKAGTCGSCMLRCTQGSLPPRSQAGLKDSWKAEGYFLPCVCVPESDLALTEVGADAQVGATIVSLAALSPDVLNVRLRCDTALPYRAGQYVTVLRSSGLARSYSIACIPEPAEIELHVRRIPNGKMSGWLHEEAPVGDRVSIVGPSGECFYVPGNDEQPVLLVGTGTGLAPLYGILRDALRHGHRGPLKLFHGALQTGGLYLVDELRRLAAEYDNFDYTPTVVNGSELDGVAVGPIDRVVLERLGKLNGWRTYICGDPSLVKSLKKKFFLAGAASREIFADAFVPAS